MFSELLVPLDGTPASATALVTARALARILGARVALLRVVAASADDAEEAEAAAHLATIAAALCARGVPVHARVRRGDPARQTVAAADGTQLIVATRHGRHGLGRLLFGGVADRVIAGSRTPLLVLKLGGHRPTQLRVLLVPVDGSDRDAAALGTAVELARAADARLVLVRAVVPVYAYLHAGDALGGLSAVPYVDAEADEDALRGAQTYVHGLVELLGRVGVGASGWAVAGAIVGTIVAAADQAGADVIVMSTRGRTGLKRALLGSVADAVQRTAHQAVVVIRHGRSASTVAGQLEGVALASPAPPARG